MFMENNFFNYITNPLSKEEIDLWFKSNNIIFEKVELFFDFSYSLTKIVRKTYLGDSTNKKQNIKMSNQDNENHFDWCWKKNLTNFEKENIVFNESGEHYKYFKDFFFEVFYNTKKKEIKESIGDFIKDIFSLETEFSKSDLDLLLTIYKSLESNMVYISLHKN